jgi:type IV pilus assembly protein PilQ
MMTFRAVAVASAFALTASAYPIETPAPAGAAEATVMSLIVRPDSQRVDVMVGVQGLAPVKDFVLRNPDRIVIDISNATLGLKAQAYDHAARGGIVNVHFAQNKPNVVRVVLTLDAAHPYKLTREAEGLRVSVMGSSSTLPAWVAGYQSARLASVTPPAAIPKEAQRNVSRAEPPVMKINGRTVPVPVAQQQSQERRITINFENLPIIEVLKIFSEYSGRSIVASNKVTGTISASIADVPWDIALQALLNLNGFDAVENQFGMITVDTFQNQTVKAAQMPLTTQTISFNYTSASTIAEILKTRLSRDCPTATTTTSATPSPATGGLTTAAGDPGSGVQQAVQPQQQQVVNTAFGNNCAVRGGIAFDTLTNSVHITDIPTNVDALVAYARTLDRRQPQVNIKAKIILVDRTQLEGLGLRYDLGSQSQFFTDIVQRSDSNGALLPANTSQIALGGNTISAIANAGARVPGAALQLAYSTALGAFDFTTFFEALQTTSLLDVQAEPNGTVMNNQTLLLSAGTDVPIRTQEQGAGANSAGNVATVTVRTVTTGVILQVTPRVTNDGRVQMKVKVENSSVTFSGADAIAFPKQSVENVIMIADGATWVIGGLTQTSVTSTRTGLPLLMELPIIGRLFGVTNRQETKRDLLILITPHIVDPGQDVARPIPDAGR